MKIKQVINFFILAVFITACGEAKKPEEQAPMHIIDTAKIDDGQLAVNSIANPSTSDPNSLIGFYVGDFEAVVLDEKKAPSYFNRINISIDSIVNEILFGHSVVAGNKRPFKGNFLQKDGTYTSEAKEPGNEKYDGVFTFTINPTTKNISGNWAANDKKLAVTKRSYSLSKKIFQYDPQQNLNLDGTHIVYDPKNDSELEGEAITDEAGKFNASAVELEGKDIENMYKRDLEVMRNAIYARHGYSFKNRIMRYFFDSEISWYIPVSTDVSKELTELEKKNIALIKSYEDYATAYYDSFGR
ncbi:MAG: YARHG domain-containing protein [Bacteroidia bacterium]|nr:YARHG domain-containing protein [Bacteroidia bacterium]